MWSKKFCSKSVACFGWEYKYGSNPDMPHFLAINQVVLNSWISLSCFRENSIFQDMIPSGGTKTLADGLDGSINHGSRRIWFLTGLSCSLAPQHAPKSKQVSFLPCGLIWNQYSGTICLGNLFSTYLLKLNKDHDVFMRIKYWEVLKWPWVTFSGHLGWQMITSWGLCWLSNTQKYLRSKIAFKHRLVY